MDLNHLILNLTFHRGTTVWVDKSIVSHRVHYFKQCCATLHELRNILLSHILCAI